MAAMQDHRMRSPIAQSLPPPRGRIPRAHLRRAGIGQRPAQEYLVQHVDDATQVCSSPGRQTRERFCEDVSLSDRIAARAGTVIQSQVYPAPRLIDEAPISGKRGRDGADSEVLDFESGDRRISAA
jgi:hypothetical protein